MPFLLLMTLLFSSGHAAAQEPAVTIEAGERIRSVALGITPEQVILWMGQPDEIEDYEDGAPMHFHYDARNLVVQFAPFDAEEPGVVEWIETREPADRDAWGLGVGSAMEDVKAQYGDAYDPLEEDDGAFVMDYYEAGIQFELDAQGIVVAVSVLPAVTDTEEDWLLES